MIGSRRDLLKYFGIGTAIVPLVGGVPKTEAPAELIAVPEVKPLVTPEQLPKAWQNIHAFESAVLGNYGQADIEVHITTADKRVWHFKANTFITKTQTSVADVTSVESPMPWRNQLSAIKEMKWKMEGTCTGSNSLDAWEFQK